MPVRTDVPRLVCDLVKFENLHTFDGLLRQRPVHLVGKKEDRYAAEVAVREHLLQLVLGDTHADGVRRVDNKDDAADILVIMLPEIPIAALPRHVEDCERNVVLLKLLHVEANGRNNVSGNGLRPRFTAAYRKVVGSELATSS